jgi:Flp pilus assembly protein TadG
MNGFQRQLARRFVRKEHGAVILETAIMLMILLMFAFGIIDFGRVMYVSNALTNATRDAARWAAVQGSPPAATAIQDSVRRRFNSYTFGGPALAQGDIVVAGPTSGGAVTILVTYPFKWLTPLPRLLGWTTNSSPVTSSIHAQAIFKYEY